MDIYNNGNYNDWEKYAGDGPVSLDGESLGDMCIQQVDDILFNKFQFHYKGKPVKFTDIEIVVYGEKNE
tara:strand:- start:607 stop:813 length:207 start_codon:yes stop_codon:yes gene_type:complete